MHGRRVFWAAAVATAAACCASATHAAIMVPLSTYYALPGGTVVADIAVNTDVSAAVNKIEGMTFTVQVGDGEASKPVISSVDLLTNTIWTGHVSAVTTPSGGATAQFQSRLVITDNIGDYIDANGRLAKVTFSVSADTPTGDYPIRLTGTLDSANDSEFLDGNGADVPANFGVGTLHVGLVPEPASLTMLAIGAVGVGRRRS